MSRDDVVALADQFVPQHPHKSSLGLMTATIGAEREVAPLPREVGMLALSARRGARAGIGLASSRLGSVFCVRQSWSSCSTRRKTASEKTARTVVHEWLPPRQSSRRDRACRQHTRLGCAAPSMHRERHHLARAGCQEGSPLNGPSVAWRGQMGRAVRRLPDFVTLATAQLSSWARPIRSPSGPRM